MIYRLIFELSYPRCNRKRNTSFDTNVWGGYGSRRMTGGMQCVNLEETRYAEGLQEIRLLLFSLYHWQEGWRSVMIGLYGLFKVENISRLKDRNSRFLGSKIES